MVHVAIGIVVREGKVLICRRRSSDPFGGYWEFPGGKIEEGETPQQCLVRELTEELGSQVHPTSAFATIDYTYSKGPVRLYPFACDLMEGEPRPIASDEVKWVRAEALREHRMPEANAGLIEQIIERLAAAAPRH